MIWTTTPWTIPGNRAMAYRQGDGLSGHRGYRCRRRQPRACRREIADRHRTSPRHSKRHGHRERRHRCGRARAQRWPARSAAHPLRGKGYDFDVPMFAGDFVTTEQGTGVVHIAPGHGADDWELGRANGIEVPQTVSEDGSFYPQVPLFAGKRVLRPDGKKGDADPAVIAALKEAGALLAQGKLTHSYPHSWRSKAPLIFRNTAQWFISMDDERSAQEGAGRHRRHQVRSAAGPQPPLCHDRAAAGLVRVAAARLGRADRRLRRQEDRPAAAGPERDRPHRRHIRERRRGCLVLESGVAVPRQRLQCRRFRAGDGHHRGLVRKRLDPRLRAGAAPGHGSGLAGRSLSRRLRPASRLVPFLAAGILRHPRPGALQRRADPRLHAGRAGPQDGEVPGQRAWRPRT